MRLTLVPEYGRGDIVSQGKITSATAPSQRLNGHAQVLLEADGVHNMTAVHTEALLTTVQAIWLDHLGQSKKRCGVNAIFSLLLLPVPSSTKIILGARSTDCS